MALRQSSSGDGKGAAAVAAGCFGKAYALGAGGRGKGEGGTLYFSVAIPSRFRGVSSCCQAAGLLHDDDGNIFVVTSFAFTSRCWLTVLHTLYSLLYLDFFFFFLHHSSSFSSHFLPQVPMWGPL